MPDFDSSNARVLPVPAEFLDPVEAERAAAIVMAREAQGQAVPPTSGGRRQRRPRGEVRFLSESEELTLDAVKVRSKLLNVSLRKTIAVASICFVSLQLVCSNVFFWIYLSHVVGSGKDIEASIMIAWMSTSVVEIVAILGIVATSLFPSKNWRKATSSSAGD
ncbi:hypothetical protein [Arthrobacter psychrolactophilus]